MANCEAYPPSCLDIEFVPRDMPEAEFYGKQGSVLGRRTKNPYFPVKSELRPLPVSPTSHIQKPSTPDNLLRTSIVLEFAGCWQLLTRLCLYDFQPHAYPWSVLFQMCPSPLLEMRQDDACNLR